MTQTVKREAISYGRFSSKRQETGDSQDRQKRAYGEVLRRYPALAESARKFFDAGKSGFHGKHMDGGDLGRFLAMVRSGEIKAPSVLVIEQWSRFSRIAPDLAVGILSEIVRSGVDVVVHTPDMFITPDLLGTPQFAMIAILLQVAHQESKTKSEMALRTLEGKRASGKPMKGKCPSWLSWNDGAFALNDRADILRKACLLSIAGHGATEIRRRLGIDSETTWGGLTQMFRSRALLGEFQPLKRIGKATEPVRSNYYPALLTEAEFYSLQESLDGRRTMKAPRGKTQTNLFGNLIHSAYDASVLWIRTHHKTKERYLNSSDNIKGMPGKDTKGLAYKFAEETILMAFTDLDEADLYPNEANQTAEQIASLKGRIARQTENITVWTAEALQGAAGLSKLISQASEQVDALTGELEALRRESTKDAGNALGQVRDIVGYLAGLEGDELLDARVRLRKLLPQLITRIEVEISGYRSASFRCVLVNGRILDVDGSGSKWGTVVVGEEFACVG